jgi:SulP family sulfate permease
VRIGRERGWTAASWAPLIPLAAAGLCLWARDGPARQRLIAAFTAGLAFGTLASAEEEKAAEMIETVGDGFSAATFLVFGAAIVPVMLDGMGWAPLLFAVLALTVVRMVPVALALLGLGARLPTIAFVGWFGPRGLASIVFAVLILQGEAVPNLQMILATISLTVIPVRVRACVSALPLTGPVCRLGPAQPAPDEPVTVDGRVIQRVRAGLRGWFRPDPPGEGDIRQEAIAGIPGAIGSVPDGMAAAVLTGVNPVFGLYASFAGPIGGGLTASTRLMVITTTSAAALAAGSAVAIVPADQRPAALFLLTLIAGGLMVVAGVLRLGRYTRFVSHSVMIGFLTGVAVNIVAGQIPDLVGAPSEGPLRDREGVQRPDRSGIDRLRHPSPWASRDRSILLLVGRNAVGFVRGDRRTGGSHDRGRAPRRDHCRGRLRCRRDSAGVAPATPPRAQPDQLRRDRWRDGGCGDRPRAGVRRGRVGPEPRWFASNANQDFMAQRRGKHRVIAVRGQPVGGSVGQTALNIAAGPAPAGRPSSPACGCSLILVAFGGIVGRVAMPTLAAVLIVAAIGSLRIPRGADRVADRAQLTDRARHDVHGNALPARSRPPWASVSRSPCSFQLNRGAMDLRVVELREREDGRFEERPAPKTLPDRSVTVLDVYGSLLYAGARTLEARLPNPGPRNAGRRASRSWADHAGGDGTFRPSNLCPPSGRTWRPALS